MSGRAATLLLVVAATTCGGPFLVIRGGRLSGEVVREPVEDWPSADHRSMELETRPSDPYPVQLNYFVRDGELYIDPGTRSRD